MSFAPDAEQRRAEAADSYARAAALRRANEQATAELTARLPFRWVVGKVHRRYQGPPVWERGPAALHIKLLADVQLLIGRTGYDRKEDDWLCTPRLDTSTGELRYDPETSPLEILHYDGTGGAAGHYWPAPTCKKCLALAAKFPPRDGKS